MNSETKPNEDGRSDRKETESTHAAADAVEGTDRQEGTDGESSPTASADTFQLCLDADRLAPLLDGAAALVDECRLVIDEGVELRARDPADVAMAELTLDTEAFEAYTADRHEFGIALDRLRDAVSMADDAPLRVSLGERGRLRVEAGAFEYALAPIDPASVRAVEWIEADAVAARATIDVGDLRRAVRAADLVADHAAFAVDPDAATLTVSASGDADDVALAFGAADLSSFEADNVESLYAVDYLGAIVGAIPADEAVELAFVGTAGTEGHPLALRHDLAGGDGAGRWLLAPRIRR